MQARLALIVAGLATVQPAWADKKLDPDPAFLPKARSAATATVEAHYDLVSDKVPFWDRFVICAGQLTAARDEGRALPIPKEEIDRLIADYRTRAADLAAYRQKADATAKPLDVDAEIAKVRSGAMSYLPADTIRLGVDRMKILHGNRLAFCQLSRDWYEVQNGLRPPASAADQQKFAKMEAEERTREKAQRPALTSVVPPLKPATAQPSSQPPVLAPKPVQPVAAAPAAAPPPPAAKVVVPDPGTTVGGIDMRDVRVGVEGAIAPAAVSADFNLRPLWSALAECVARMDLIEQRGGGSTRVQSQAYAKRAAYILWGSRGDIGGKNLPAMEAPVAQERMRLGPRVAASWDDHRQRTGQPPLAVWGQVCHALNEYAGGAADRILAAKRAQAQRDHAEAMKKFNAQSSSSSSSGSSSGGSYGGYSGPTNSGAADHQRVMNEHQQTMQRYQRENQQIRNEIRAIDRKYGR